MRQCGGSWTGRAARSLDAHVSAMHRMAGDRKDWVGKRHVWRMTQAQVLGQLRAAVASGDERNLSHGMTPSKAMAMEGELRTEVAKIVLAIEDAEAVYREHRWTRWFPCLNRDGHIHSSRCGCPTVRFDTAMGWTPELSGKTIEDAVAELGEALCAVCFPAAPAEWKSKTVGQVKDERTRTEREAAKAQWDAVKAAKNLTKDEQFKDHSGWWVTTVAACKQLLRDEVEFRYYYGRGPHPSHPASIVAAATARRVLLARGVDAVELDNIVARAEKKHAKYAS